MKMIVKKNMLALGLSMTVLAGCSTTDTLEDDPSIIDPTDPTAEASPIEDVNEFEARELSDAEKAAAEAAEAALEAAAQEKELAALREIRTFYFDFDKSDIKAESRLPLIAHAKLLAANPNIKVVVEGHCDERGTKEYNMALGENRAKAVERFLVVNGVARDQIEVLSLGEERPADAGHDEAAWSKNRRSVLAYK